MMGLSFAFTLVSLGLSLRTYDVEMERLFYQPNPLFNTEALLIDALRKHSEIEISKRDELIAEYKRRVAMRDQVLKNLLAKPAPSPEAGTMPRNEGSISAPAQAAANPVEEGSSAEATKPVTEMSDELRNLAQSSILDKLYAQRLAQTFDSVSKRLGDQDLAGAASDLDALHESLSSTAGSASPMVGAALTLSIDLSAAIARLRTLSTSRPKPAEDNSSPALLAALRQAQTLLASTRSELAQAKSAASSSQTALAKLDEANRRLRERLVGLEAPNSAPGQASASQVQEGVPSVAGPAAPIQPSSAEAPTSEPGLKTAASSEPPPLSPPTSAAAPPPAAPKAPTPTIRAAFLGTVAVVTDSFILVDLADGASPKAGARVAVYGRGSQLELPPLVQGVVSSISARIAQISLAAQASGAGSLGIRLQDPVYVVK